MTQDNPYKDIRQDFFKSFFDKALHYDEYVKTGNLQHQERWKNSEELPIPAELSSIVMGWKRKMNLLVMSGTWCGDCVRQGPMLKLIQEKFPLINLKFIDNQANPLLQDELKINGANKVPVVVTLSEDFYEIGRFGDMHRSRYLKKLTSELGAACDAGLIRPKFSELEQEIMEWVYHLDRHQAILRLSPLLRRRYND